VKISGIIAGAVAFLCCVALVPAVKAFCEHLGLFDSPGPLKIHSQPIPRLGGVAIAISFATALLVSSRHNLAPAFPFLAALSLIWLTGLVDDIRGLSPVIRLAAQIAGAIMLWLGGWRLPLFGNSTIGLICLCFFVVAFVNAFNFWDGADGVAAGTAAIIAMAYVAQTSASQSRFTVAVAWALAGTCFAFLIENFPPAKLFMGDSGSTMLGLVVAFITLNPNHPRATTPLIALYLAILPSTLPLLDAAFAILRRLRNRGSPLWGDRFHFYDQMLARGYSARKVTLTCYGITAIFCFGAYLASRLAANYSNALAIAISAIVVVGFVVVELRLGALRASEAKRPPQQGAALHLSNPIENSR
jgi:UDP-GlcNAc:undecaprenyl-phosphate/decaprenyl-phosphate GlcNAc-1-phosphate transferase